MGCKVSIIIPVYNAELYIAECIESLLSQTLRECEFIFVNDGSTDNSKNIIENYLQFDNRIVLINQENQGVSTARNKGLSIAEGEYVGFVDADDYVEKDMFETLYNAAIDKDNDMVISNFITEDRGKHQVTRYNFPGLMNRSSINQILFPYFLSNDNCNNVWNKIYKRKILLDNTIYFPKDRSLGEDGLFNINFISFSSKIKYIDYSGYYYREVDGSATRNLLNKDYFAISLETYRLELPEQVKNVISEDLLLEFKVTKLIKTVMSYIHVYFSPNNGLSNAQKNEYVRRMITDNCVKEALPIFKQNKMKTVGRYEKLILSLIEWQSPFGLYCATAYSRFRNR